MKINTLVEFIWNSNTNEYEEVYSESYEYEGEIALLDEAEDEWKPPDYGTGPGTVDLPPGYGSPDWSPSLEDLINADSDYILAGFGVSKSDIDKYGMWVPEYDIAREEYASGKQDIEESRLLAKKEGIGAQMGMTSQLYGMSKMVLGRQQESALEQGQQGMYDLFRQSGALASAGLGERAGMAKRAASGASRAFGRGMQDLALQGLEQRTRYETEIGQLGRERQGVELDIQRSLLDETYQIGQAREDYSQDLYDFLFSLQDYGVTFGDES